MIFTRKYKIIAAVFTVVSAFAIGRFTTPVKIKTEIKTVEVDKKTTDLDRDSQLNRHRKTTTTTVKKPDGTIETTTTTTDDAQKNTETSSVTTDDRTTKTDTTKEVTRGAPPVTISVLAGLKLTDFSTPIYGLSATKPILGLVAVGVWGFNNGMAGVSIGLQF